MRTLFAFLLLASVAQAQFDAPLDDASLLYRAQPYDPALTQIPSEGLRDDPLQFGPTAGTDTEDPAFVSDAVLGDYFHYVLADNDHAVSPVPVEALNGDVTFAIRYRQDVLWADRLLLSVVDPSPQTKHFMLHVTAGNKYMARFWEHPTVGWAQIGATSTTSVSTSRTDTVVVTWDSATKENKLYVNGALEATGTTGKIRSNASVSGLQVPLAYTTLKPAGKVFSIALWERTLSATEVADLQVNPDWYEGGGYPPPPPPMGALRVRVNGTELAPGTTVTIDGVPVDPPTGEADKIVEVNEP